MLKGKYFNFQQFGSASRRCQFPLKTDNFLLGNSSWLGTPKVLFWGPGPALSNCEKEGLLNENETEMLKVVHCTK